MLCNGLRKNKSQGRSFVLLQRNPDLSTLHSNTLTWPNGSLAECRLKAKNRLNAECNLDLRD
jgi:hypothetical protein